MAQQIRLRQGSSTEWSTANSVLALGELGLDTTVKQLKIGDGTTAWNSLPFTGGTSTALVPLSQVIDFRSTKAMPAAGFYTQTGPIAFTLDSTGAVQDAGTTLSLIASGDPITFTGFDVIGSGAVASPGQKQFISFTYSNGLYLYSVATGAVVILPPGQVTALASTAQTDTSIALSWTAPSSGGAATDYVIEYKLAAAASTWTAFAHTASTSTSATITGLPPTSPGVAYNVRVSGKNDGGTGTLSSSITTTLANTILVPTAPTTPVATPGAGQISFAFGTPSSNGGASIDSYRVTLSTGETFTGATSPIVATGLSQVARTGTVAAHNTKGYGPESAASNSVTPTAMAGFTRDYNKADNTTTGYTGTIAGPNGAVRILSNQAAPTSASNGVNDVYEVYEGGSSNGTISESITQGSFFEMGVIFRYVDANNWVCANMHNGVYKVGAMVAGNRVGLLENYNVPFNTKPTANTFVLTFSGDQVSCLVNGVAPGGSFTLPANVMAATSAGTKHGPFWAYASPDQTIDYCNYVAS